MEGRPTAILAYNNSRCKHHSLRPAAIGQAGVRYCLSMDRAPIVAGPVHRASVFRLGIHPIDCLSGPCTRARIISLTADRLGKPGLHTREQLSSTPSIPPPSPSPLLGLPWMDVHGAVAAIARTFEIENKRYATNHQCVASYSRNGASYGGRTAQTPGHQPYR